MPPHRPVPRLGPVRRVAVLSDVHGNMPALTAVLAEPDVAAADLVLFTGDLTWGPEPHRTAETVRALGDRAVLVRGNADRAVVELARAARPAGTLREEWMPGQHTGEDVNWLAAFHFTVVVEVAGLGPVRCCHGSPRGDTELITPGTPDDRMTEIRALFPEPTLVSGHCHLQFDRTAAGIRSVNAGSVGLPFHDGEPGTAYWALLGPDVQLRRTPYDVTEAVERAYGSGDPAAAKVAGLLTAPPSVADIIAHAESLRWSD